MSLTPIKLKLAALKFGGRKNENQSVKVRIAVILDSEEEEKQRSFFDLKEVFELKEEEFNLMICKTKGVKNDIFEAPCFTPKNLRWNGQIDHPEVLDFLDRDYELLICFAASENKLAGFLVSQVKADLKVGREQNKENNFDFVIETELDEPEVFLEELKKYKSIIKK